MKDVVAAVLMWLGQATAYEMPATPPSIEVEAHAAIQQIQGVSHGDFYGFYDPDANRIVLSERLDLDTDRGRGKLVHELIHWLQDETGLKSYRCYGERELEAYSVQERFEKAHGLESSVNWLWVMHKYRCPPAFAPDHTHPDHRASR
jgi:hypothetical protein